MEGFNDRFDGLERRIGALDAKVDRFGEELRADLGGRIHALDAKVDRFREELSAEFRTRIAALDLKVSRNFTWTVGIQVAVLLAVVAALAGR